MKKDRLMTLVMGALQMFSTKDRDVLQRVLLERPEQDSVAIENIAIVKASAASAADAQEFVIATKNEEIERLNES